LTTAHLTKFLGVIFNFEEKNSKAMYFLLGARTQFFNLKSHTGLGSTLAAIGSLCIQKVKERVWFSINILGRVF
jgi:hypothetical protein